jgi:hypothetical protein
MHIAALSFHLVEVSQVAAVCHILVEASLHVNAISFECILVLYHLVKNMQKRGMLSILLQPYTLFIFISLVPTCFGFKYRCFYRKES